MACKYIKRHNIQHFKVALIVFIKIPKEDRTFINNKQLFACILKETYPYKYKVITLFDIISHLIPTKGLSIVNKSLWSNITILNSIIEVTLKQAAKAASISA
jgi:hypothetical protein